MTGFPPGVRRLVVDRSRGACEVNRPGCTLIVTDLHHRRPRGMGGDKRPDTNVASNSLALCRPCHAWVEANRAEAMELGWLVRSALSPASQPVRLRGMWGRLDDEGNFEAGGWK